MGQWVITIEGHGLHDNGRLDDAEVMLRDFVAELQAQGQQIGRVSFTTGNTRTLIPDTAAAGKFRYATR